VGPDRQSYTEYITWATFLQCFAKQQRGCRIANVLFVQLGNLGERCKLPQRVRVEPGAERYLLHFGLKKASDESNFTCIFTKEYPKFDKLRDLVYVHSKRTFTAEQSRLICSTLPRYGSSWWPIQRAARILATDSRWYRWTTSVVPLCGSAHILQNERLSDQHVACYIHLHQLLACDLVQNLV